MIAMLALTAALAAPLSVEEAFDLLTFDADQLSLAKLDAKCKQSADVILRAPTAEVVRIVKSLQVRCAKTRFPKLAAMLDARASACASEGEPCAAWLAHARAALIDVLGPEGTGRDFARVITTLAAKGVGDVVDAAAAERAIEAADRMSSARADSAPTQRIALVTWFLLPSAKSSDGLAALIPRVLTTNPDDPEVWGAFTYMAQVGKLVEAGKTFLDAVSRGATTATQRGKAYYLRGCLGVYENDNEGARDAFTSAAKADPFEGTYKKALADVNAGVKLECKIVVTPFATPLRDALAR